MAAKKVVLTIGDLVDQYWSVRERRYALQREAVRCQEEEALLSAQLIDRLPKAGTTAAAGKIASAQLDSRPFVRVEDWDALYQHVKRTGAFELLHRRVNEGAVKERWEAKKTVPGCVLDKATVVKLSKV